MSRRFLALGDSYTVGEGVAPRSGAWPALLVRRLRDARVDVAAPEIVARTGWTTDELSVALDAVPSWARFDLVTLLVGVNDQYRGGTANAYRRSIAALIARAIALADARPARVIVLSIPDWGVTPFGSRDPRGPAAISAAIRRFNAINREQARRAGTRYVDVTGTSRRAAEAPALLASDGLHPSRAMYEQWVERILPEALAALEAAAQLQPPAPR